MSKKTKKKQTESLQPKTNDLTQLLESSEEVDEIIENEGYETVSYAPMLKPGDIPEGQAIRGTILGAIDSPKIEGQKLLQIRVAKTGQEISLPAARAIAIFLLDKNTGELKEGLEGKEVVIKRTGTRMSEKNNKNFPIFEVSISK